MAIFRPGLGALRSSVGAPELRRPPQATRSCTRGDAIGYQRTVSARRLRSRSASTLISTLMEPHHATHSGSRSLIRVRLARLTRICSASGMRYQTALSAPIRAQIEPISACWANSSTLICWPRSSRTPQMRDGGHKVWRRISRRHQMSSLSGRLRRRTRHPIAQSSRSGAIHGLARLPTMLAASWMVSPAVGSSTETRTSSGASQTRTSTLSPTVDVRSRLWRSSQYSRPNGAQRQVGGEMDARPSGIAAPEGSRRWTAR